MDSTGHKYGRNKQESSFQSTWETYMDLPHGPTKQRNRRALKLQESLYFLQLLTWFSANDRPPPQTFLSYMPWMIFYCALEKGPYIL